MNAYSQENDVHPHAAELRNDDGSWKYTNRLTNETSPYLLQHAHNPVDWYPWGTEAFDAARDQGKPIFLSVGYSTCYWCHVMERQVFENPAIAAEMNEKFINVKVDREERPDIDDIYMMATQLMTGRGGWPMSVFLTPPGAANEDDTGLKPFYAGTYFPPEPGHGLPSFPQLIEGLSNAWQTQRQEVLDQAQRLADAAASALSDIGESGPVSPETVTASANDLLRSYEPEHGGFGAAPKFPQPVNLQLLLAVYRNNPSEQLGQAIAHTLDRMARGGMYDQVGGGFHRYSTDAQWLVPHFEKMLYDNGQLIEVYAMAYGLESDEATRHQYRRVIDETAKYLVREMTDNSGAFFSAQDAEVNAMEGENYVWTPAEVRETIADEVLADFALKLYGIDRGPNFKDPHAPSAQPVNVLFLPEKLASLGDNAAAQRDRVNEFLLQTRDQRDQPSTDDKVLTAWNGLVIAGLAEAGRVLNEPGYLDLAEAAAGAIIAEMMTDQGTLLRSMRDGQARIPGFLEDYAFLIKGLLALHTAERGDGRYLSLAQELTGQVLLDFAIDEGGYYDTLANQSDLFVRTRATHDGAVPSGNSQMIHNQVALFEVTGDAIYIDRAAKDLGSFSGDLQQQRAGMAHMQHALLRAIEVSPAAFDLRAVDEPKTRRSSPVQASAERRGEVTVVTLVINKPFHINAHEPSLDYLIATSIDAEGLQIDYPKPTQLKSAFATELLDVYEGEIKVTIHGHPASVSLTYQACTDTTCKAPVTQEIAVK